MPWTRTRDVHGNLFFTLHSPLTLSGRGLLLVKSETELEIFADLIRANMF